MGSLPDVGGRAFKAIWGSFFIGLEKLGAASSGTFSTGALLAFSG